MAHLFFLYFSLSLLSSLMMFIFSLYQYAVRKETYYINRVFLVLSFACLVVTQAIWSYMENTHIHFRMSAISFFLQISIPCLIVTLPLFAISWIKIVLNRVQKTLYVSIGAFCFIIFTANSVFYDNDFLPFLLFLGGMMVLAILGTSILLLRYGIKNRKRDGLGRLIIGIIGLLLLPGFVLFDIYSFVFNTELYNCIFPVLTVPLYNLLINTVLLVEDFQSFISSSNFRNESFPLEKACNDYHLTKRETEVLRELLKGKSYTEIGNELYISQTTVKTHVIRIYSKFSVTGKMDLVNLLHKMRINYR